MISRLFFIFFVSLNLSTTALAESYAVKVLNSKVEDYERALSSLASFCDLGAFLVMTVNVDTDKWYSCD